MDADSENISQRVDHTKKKQCVNGEAQWHSPTSMPAIVDAVSKVLDDDNLLREIMVCVGFPTTLVCAALVCKRWYHHVSDPAFLRRFRQLHPLRLLGFYLDEGVFRSAQDHTPFFIPMQPQVPELAAIVRCVTSHNFGAYERLMFMDSRNGSVFTCRREGRVLTHEVHRPLCPEKDRIIVPPLPTAQDDNYEILGAILSKEEGCGVSYLYVLVELIDETENFMVRVYMLQGGVWCMHTTATDQLHHKLIGPRVVLVDNRIYMVACGTDIIILDLTASTFSRIQLPHGVTYHNFYSFLSRADDASGVYLTHVRNQTHQLCIWLYKGDNWLLVDTICLVEMWANLRMLDHTLENEDIGFTYICQVGDNVEFVFLKTCGRMFYLDVTNVHKLTNWWEHGSTDVYPFMMIWLPIFPALKDDPPRNVM